MNWQRVKEFWTAEEVPRWIGMSLVAVFLIGLATVGYRAVSDTRESLSDSVRQANERSVDLLVTMLSQVRPDDQYGWQRVLRSYAASYPCEQLRIVDDKRMVVASTHPDEVGRPDAFDPGLGTLLPNMREIHALPSSTAANSRWLFRAPLLTRRVVPTAGATTGEQEPVDCFVEGVLIGDAPTAGTSVIEVSLGTIAAVLIVGTLFLAVYRAMRRHFRSMSLISENLLSRGEQLEQDLAALRLSDGQSALGQQWNQLIDLLDELSGEARRAAAAGELKQALEHSRQSEIAEVVNAIPDGVLYLVEGDQVAYANTMARHLLGLPADQRDRVRLSEVAGSETARRIIECPTGALSADGFYTAGTQVVEHESGHSSYRVRIIPLRRSRRAGECVVLIADISQQVRADRAREEFVSQVTHELRTPLTNIRAYAETLSSGVFDDPAVITECYNVITKETRRLSRLIEDILSISQLEVGAIELRVDDVDLRSLLTDAVRDLRGLADEQHIDVQLSLASKLPPFRGDREKLSVVINNLLGNALKYTQAGGSVNVGCKANGEEVLLTVKDDGIGIDPCDHDRVFEKFQRGSDPQVANIQGTGIGLTTAREIVRRHGGEIELISAAGEGATFIVHLPLPEAATATVKAREE